MINDLEDIVEDTLIEILHTKPPSDLQPAILYRAVHMEAIDHYRKLRRRGMAISENREDGEDKRPQEEHLQSADPPIDEGVWAKQLEAAVEHCMNRLTAKQKHVLGLRAESLTLEEIGQVFNISHEAARTICQRARDSLRRCLKTKNIDVK
jgi:RNA polymerase sigma factor (sigma-70 family)